MIRFTFFNILFFLVSAVGFCAATPVFGISEETILLAQVNFVESEKDTLAGKQNDIGKTAEQKNLVGEQSAKDEAAVDREKPRNENSAIGGYKQDKSATKKTQLNIDGYLNAKYVRLVVDIDNKKAVTGYLFDKSGRSTYVYGEYVYGALHVYDAKGNHYTIVNPDLNPYFLQDK